MVSKPTTDIRSNVLCYAMTLSGEAWGFETDFSGLITGLKEFALGYWLKLSNTVSNKVLQIGTDSGPHYTISSVDNGVLNGVYYKDTSATDPSNNFSFKIPINEWIGIAFNFQESNSVVTLNILITTKGKISITSDANSLATFKLPEGYFFLSNSVNGIISHAFIAESAVFEGSEYRELKTGVPGSQNWSKETTICTADCADDVCDFSNSCTSSYTLCGCLTSQCDSCSEPARDPSQYCLKCVSRHSFKNHHCCSDDLANCLDCSPLSGTICTLCEAGYFLYNNGLGTVSCISCADSCTYCSPNPQCFLCSSLIVQAGDTCRVDSIGYQIGFSKSNIEIDFANALTTDFTLSSITAYSDASPSTPLTTIGWTLNECKAGATQCSIKTDIKESQLPISLDLEFNQVSA
ncbi:unnamed protein product [Blepharisma stoltei]|uniref:Uncharacterized protein n=1 Tax=Blepharisma stoltei TaxID=1481888 RepID=A0AAU9JF44_9CILI|nr:unnamed protein product [Blepharisma stoltei]